jgi:hypothetical protein
LTGSQEVIGSIPICSTEKQAVTKFSNCLFCLLTNILTNLLPVFQLV